MFEYQKTYIEKNRHLMFDKKRDAIEKNARNIEKKNGKYWGYCDIVIKNSIITGRKMHVIDENKNIYFQILNIIQSYPFDGTSKLEGFEGIFVNKSSLKSSLDLYCNINVINDSEVKEKINNLHLKEYNRFISIEENTKASKTLIENLTKSDWDKAKEDNYI